MLSFHPLFSLCHFIFYLDHDTLLLLLSVIMASVLAAVRLTRCQAPVAMLQVFVETKQGTNKETNTTARFPHLPYGTNLKGSF